MRSTGAGIQQVLNKCSLLQLLEKSAGRRCVERASVSPCRHVATDVFSLLPDVLLFLRSPGGTRVPGCSLEHKPMCCRAAQANPGSPRNKSSPLWALFLRTTRRRWCNDSPTENRGHGVLGECWVMVLMGTGRVPISSLCLILPPWH